MLYHFKKSKSTVEMQKQICAVYREGVVTDQTCQTWFAKFHEGNFLLDNAPWSGRPVEVDHDQIEALTENDQCYQVLKIICTSSVVFINLMFGFHIS